jgi:hypothetical protein
MLLVPGKRRRESPAAPASIGLGAYLDSATFQMESYVTEAGIGSWACLAELKKTILRVSPIPGGIPRRIVRMTLKQIAGLGRELTRFLALFVGCFRSRPGFALARIYVEGLLANLQRKNIEAIALEFATAPRCATNASGWWPATRRIPRPSAASTNRARPRAAAKPSVRHGSGWAVAARSTTASWACM